MQPIFDTTAIGLIDWLEIVAASFFLFVIMWIYSKLVKVRQYD